MSTTAPNAQYTLEPRSTSYLFPIDSQLSLHLYNIKLFVALFFVLLYLIRSVYRYLTIKSLKEAIETRNAVRLDANYYSFDYIRGVRRDEFLRQIRKQSRTTKVPCGKVYLPTSIRKDNIRTGFSFPDAVLDDPQSPQFTGPIEEPCVIATMYIQSKSSTGYSMVYPFLGVNPSSIASYYEKSKKAKTLGLVIDKNHGLLPEYEEYFSHNAPRNHLLSQVSVIPSTESPSTELPSSPPSSVPLTGGTAVSDKTSGIPSNQGHPSTSSAPLSLSPSPSSEISQNSQYKEGGHDPGSRSNQPLQPPNAMTSSSPTATGQGMASHSIASVEMSDLGLNNSTNANTTSPHHPANTSSDTTAHENDATAAGPDASPSPPNEGLEPPTQPPRARHPKLLSSPMAFPQECPLSLKASHALPPIRVENTSHVGRASDETGSVVSIRIPLSIFNQVLKGRYQRRSTIPLVCVAVGMVGGNVVVGEVVVFDFVHDYSQSILSSSESKRILQQQMNGVFQHVTHPSQKSTTNLSSPSSHHTSNGNNNSNGNDHTNHGYSSSNPLTTFQQLFHWRDHLAYYHQPITQIYADLHDTSRPILIPIESALYIKAINFYLFLSLVPTFGLSRDEDDVDCSICYCEPKRIILLPCRHICSCTACTEKLVKCPLCRTAITSYCIFSMPGANVEPDPMFDQPDGQRGDDLDGDDLDGEDLDGDNSNQTPDITADQDHGNDEHHSHTEPTSDISQHQDQRRQSASAMSRNSRLPLNESDDSNHSMASEQSLNSVDSQNTSASASIHSRLPDRGDDDDETSSTDSQDTSASGSFHSR